MSCARHFYLFTYPSGKVTLFIRGRDRLFVTTSEERGKLLRRLELQAADDEWETVRQELERQSAKSGLPAPTDEDVHVALEERMSADEKEALRREIMLGVEEAERGELIDGEEFLEKLKLRYTKKRSE